MRTSSTGINRCSGVRRRDGFTLIELMVALAVMVIVSGVTLLAMVPAMHDAKLRASCRMVASALNYARSRAVTTNTTMRVIFDQGESVEVDSSTNDPKNGLQLTPLTTAAGKRESLPEGITVTRVVKSDGVSDENWVEFDNLGEADQASIEITDNGGDARYVIVDPITGRCRIQTNVENTRNSAQTIR